MPTIPIYNQSATEEAGLTRAKKRVIGYMEQGIAQLTERPDKDITNGKADDIANLLINRFEDLVELFDRIAIYFQEIEDDDYEPQVVIGEPEEAKKVLKLVIATAKLIGRIVRTAKALAPVMRFLDLGILSDLKTAQENAEQSGNVAFTYLMNINLDELQDEEWRSVADEEVLDEDEDDVSVLSVPSRVSFDQGQRRIDSMFNRMIQAQRELEGDSSSSQSSASQSSASSTSGSSRDTRRATARINTIEAFNKSRDIYERLVGSMRNAFNNVLDILEKAYANFNEFRTQKVLPAEAIATEGGYFKIGSRSFGKKHGGSSVRTPTYRIGNNVMSALYEIDGLPRFI
jgi:hypothetical protein